MKDAIGNEQLLDTVTAFEEALDHIESLNTMWNWRSIHRNDVSEFKSVQAFLAKHGRCSQTCEF
jgi:hypothetical protein